MADNSNNPNTIDVLVVGAGPIGIACGIAAKRRGLSCRVFDKGSLTDALTRFPAHMVYFSTAELLEIGDVPLVISGSKPTRNDTLYYYRRVTEHHDIDVRLYERVDRIVRANSGFTVVTERGQYAARYVIIAIGFFDFPNMLGIAGEDLPKVAHYYHQPHPYYRQRVAVIGGGNSAVEAALELFRNGAEVTLIHRRADLSSGIKYWVRPDIENRIREGSIRAFFETRVERIEPDQLILRHADDTTRKLPNDFVLALTGYHTDFGFLRAAGVRVDPESLKPDHNPETLETNVPNLYVAGVVSAGVDYNKVFIENSREHADWILADIAGKAKQSHVTLPAPPQSAPPSNRSKR